MKKLKYLLVFILLGVFIFSADYLFGFLASENLTPYQAFLYTCYFALPSLLIWCASVITGLLINGKNINWLRSHKILLFTAISLVAVALFVFLVFNYEFNLKSDGDFSWAVSTSGFSLILIFFPKLTKEILFKTKIIEKDKSQTNSNSIL